MISSSALFTASRVCEMTGIAVVELEWMEEELGDLLEIRRTAGGARLFTAGAVDRLREIKRLLDEEEMELHDVRTNLTSPAEAVVAMDIDADPVLDARDAAEIAAAARAFSGPGDPGAEDHGVWVPEDGEPASSHGEELDPGDTVRIRREELPAASDPDLGGVAVSAEHGGDESDLDDGVPAETMQTIPRGWSSHDVALDAIPADHAGTDLPPPHLVMAQAVTAETWHESVGTPVSSPAASDDADPSEVMVPPLPLRPTVDLLLEAAEGLVKENLKLRRAVDTLADRCLRLEESVGRLDGRKGWWRRLTRS